jgi:hypothetical protein
MRCFHAKSHSRLRPAAQQVQSLIAAFRGCRWWVVALIVILQMPVSNAAPSNCDGDMSEDQKFQTSLCSAHVGCRFVMSLFDSCVSVKGFVAKLDLGSKAGNVAVKDVSVEDALIASGVTRAKLSSCLFSFDRNLCRQYLGLDPIPIETPKEPYKTPRKTELLDLKSALMDEQQRAKGSLSAYLAARNGLALCESAKDLSDRDWACKTAQSRVQECEQFRDGWYRRKSSALGDAAKEGIGDLMASLQSVEMPACPTTLPVAGLTPEQALAEWTQSRSKTDDMIVRCDGLRREASAAVDNGPGTATQAALAAFENGCSKQRREYADVAQLLRQRLADQSAAQPPSVPASGPAVMDATSAAPLRRGGSSTTQLFNQSIAVNEVKLKEEAQTAERNKRERDAEIRRQAEARQDTNNSPTASTNATHYKTCLEILQAFDNLSGTSDSRDYFNREQAAGRTTPRMIAEQALWLNQYYFQIVNKFPICSNSEERKIILQRRTEKMAECQCQVGKNYWSNEARFNSALQTITNPLEARRTTTLEQNMAATSSTQSVRPVLAAQPAPISAYAPLPETCSAIIKEFNVQVAKYTTRSLNQAYDQSVEVWQAALRFAKSDPAGLSIDIGKSKADLSNPGTVATGRVRASHDICLWENALKLMKK